MNLLEASLVLTLVFLVSNWCARWDLERFYKIKSHSDSEERVKDYQRFALIYYNALVAVCYNGVEDKDKYQEVVNKYIEWSEKATKELLNGKI